MDFGFHRTVQDDVILSPAVPHIAVRYSPDFIYLGDLQYIARDTHHIEEFIFVNPNKLGHASHLLLVHFEGFLESKDGAYEYLPQETVMVKGEEFEYERYFLNIQDDFARFPGSDLAHAASYVRQRSYTLAGDMVFQRFRRYTSPDRRSIFSISYLEANEAQQLTPASLEAEPARAAALRARAADSFEIISFPETVLAR